MFPLTELYWTKPFSALSQVSVPCTLHRWEMLLCTSKYVVADQWFSSSFSILGSISVLGRRTHTHTPHTHTRHTHTHTHTHTHKHIYTHTQTHTHTHTHTVALVLAPLHDTGHMVSFSKEAKLDRKTLLETLLDVERPVTAMLSNPTPMGERNIHLPMGTHSSTFTHTHTHHTHNTHTHTPHTHTHTHTHAPEPEPEQQLPDYGPRHLHG